MRASRDLFAFMENLASACPKGQVSVVWDNLNIHYDGKDERWTRFNERHGPVDHQSGNWFALLQRRVLQHAD